MPIRYAEVTVIKNLSKEHISHYITRLLGEEITVNDEDNIIIKFDDGYLMDTLDFRDSESKYDDDDNDTDYNINDDYNNDDYTHDDDFNIEDENDDYNHDDDDDDSTEVITYNQNNLQCKKRIIIGPRLYYPTNCIDHFIVNKHLFQYRIPICNSTLFEKNKYLSYKNLFPLRYSNQNVDTNVNIIGSIQKSIYNMIYYRAEPGYIKTIDSFGIAKIESSNVKPRFIVAYDDKYFKKYDVSYLVDTLFKSKN